MNGSIKKIFSIIFISILYIFIPFFSYANYEQIPDDFRYGFQNDASFTWYLYHGTIFQSPNNVEFHSITLNVCDVEVTRNMGVEFLRLMDGEATDLNAGGSYEILGETTITIPLCNENATSTFPDPVTSDVMNDITIGGVYYAKYPDFTLNAGEWYGFRFTPGLDFVDYYIPSNDPFVFGITNNVLNGHSINTCFFSIGCGTGYLNDFPRDDIVSYSLDQTIIADPIGECGITSIDICFRNAMIFLFTPDNVVFEQFIELKDDLKFHAPFGYFTSAVDSIQNLNIATNTSEFTLKKSKPITNLIFDPLRSGLVWLVGFASALWLYKKLTNFRI